MLNLSIQKIINITKNYVKKIETKPDFSNNTNLNIDIKNKLKDISLEINNTKQWFNTETDNELIDASIHKLITLNSEYKYLLSKIK
ncbi:MAG: hypothetical protein IJC57_03955 [Clostridia bacterium]|nr:hypothetical protein [Clostridia bacterium]